MTGLPAELETRGRQVEAICPTKPVQQRQIAAGPTAAIEQTCVRSAGGRLSEERRDEGPKPAEPEVTRFRSRGGAQQVIHGRILSSAIYLMH